MKVWVHLDYGDNIHVFKNEDAIDNFIKKHHTNSEEIIHDDDTCIEYKDGEDEYWFFIEEIKE